MTGASRIAAMILSRWQAAGRERRLMAGLRRPALGTAGPKPASQDVVLNVSKVASNSSAGAPGIGQQPVVQAAERLRRHRPAYEVLRT